MAKRSADLGFVLPPRDSKVSAYRWLYAALRREILDGRLRPGTRLPATRFLARQYQLSRGTVVTAFEHLKAEGYLEGRVGSGTHVSRVLPEHFLQVRPDANDRAPIIRKRQRGFSVYGRRANSFPNYEDRPTRAFRTNLPALELFPVTLWAQINARRLRAVSAALLRGCEAMGYPPLREAVTDYLNSARGVKCTSAQVVIVSGVQEALDLTARLFLNPGDRVCMEDPGYPGAARVFEAIGAKITPARVDREGMTLSDLRRTRLVYVTPAHQFPLGVTMSLARRLALLEAARKSGALIFEDDYDSEYRYSGRPIPALQGLDRSGAVLFAGSFSKVMFPSLRLGYFVVPPDLVERVATAKSLTSRHAPLLEQVALCEFMSEGHFGRHIRRMREVYAERLSVLLESVRGALAGWLEISQIEAGLQTVGWLGRGLKAADAAKAAALRKIEVVPLGVYGRRPMKHEGLQLGFAAITPREIRRGASELRIALQAISKGRHDSAR